MRRATHLLHSRLAATAAASVARSSVGAGRAAAPAYARSQLFAPSRLHTQGVRFPHATTNTPLHGTTILAVRKGKDVVVIGDGQVSMGGTVFKPNARKVRIIGGGKVICGFAGSTADCFALLDALEKKLDEYPGQLLRAGVELAKMWRTDKFLRHLEALLIAVDKDISITLSGNGDVISEPLDGVIGIGSGGLYALSAARALVDVPDLTPRQIAVKSMRIAAEICVYTNKNFTIEAFENGELLSADKANTTGRDLRSVGEARLARLRRDSELAEAADKAERRKIELNSLSSITPSTNTTSADQSTITPPAPASQTPQ